MLAMMKSSTASGDQKDGVFRKSWYELSANQRMQTLGPLRGAVNSDVCVIGAGYTGLSAALSLAERGFRVVLLESGNGIAPSASGKNGGHVQRGMAQSVEWLLARHGETVTKNMCLAAFEGIDLIKQRIAKYAIDCDFHFGQMTAALTPRHIRELEDDLSAWQRIGLDDGLQMHDKASTQSQICSPAYIGALADSRSGHFHPLNYALGIATAAQKLGVLIHDNTKAIDVSNNKVITEHGEVTCQHIIMAGNVTTATMRKQLTKSITVEAHIIATQQLDAQTMQQTLPANVAVAEAKFIMNYFRRSHDNRLLFGGNCNYSGRELGIEVPELRHRLLSVFPHLKDIKIENCWHGPLDLTASRLPAFGRLDKNIYYAHGFGGHGVVLSNLAGHLMAEAVAGTAEKFDLFASVRHIPFPGGNLGKRALFMLGMFWYQLRDELR